MKFPFPFKSTEITTTTTSAAAASSWPWPTCAATPRTLSFRAAADNIYKTISPAYLDDGDDGEVIATATPRSSFSLNPESAVISGLMSERLFFKPGATSSILEEAKSDDDGGSVAMVVMDSMNPFLDFRVSMEEMAEAYCDEVRDWEFMEKLLEWYISVNDESNHGYIVAAFFDLLISAIDGNSSDSASASTKYSFTSPLSFSSSSTEDHILLHKYVP